MTTKIVKTKIKKTLRGHTVQFTIGVQTFSLKECEPQIDRIPQNSMTSYQYAKWYKTQLDTAFKNLEQLINTKTK